MVIFSEVESRFAQVKWYLGKWMNYCKWRGIWNRAKATGSGKVQNSAHAWFHTLLWGKPVCPNWKTNFVKWMGSLSPCWGLDLDSQVWGKAVSTMSHLQARPHAVTGSKSHLGRKNPVLPICSLYCYSYIELCMFQKIMLILNIISKGNLVLNIYANRILVWVTSNSISLLAGAAYVHTYVSA